MENIRVLESSSNIRSRARAALVNNWKEAIIISILFTLLIQLPSALFDNLFGIPINGITGSGVGMDVLELTGVDTEKSSFISGLYILLVTGPFCFGLTNYFISLFRNREKGITDLFDGFSVFGRSLGMMAWVYLWSFIWTFVFALPIILMTWVGIVGIKYSPGLALAFAPALLIMLIIALFVVVIVVGLRYSLSFFILIDHPEYSIRQCMRESIRLMKNNKSKLFFLNLSFIGWAIVASIVSGVIGGLFISLAGGEYSAVVLIISSCITACIMAPLIAYIQTAVVAFYEILIGNAAGETFIEGEY